MSEVTDWTKIEKLLTYRERGVIHLHFIARWSRTEVAEMLEVDKSTIDRIIVRAGTKCIREGIVLDSLLQQVRRAPTRVLKD